MANYTVADIRKMLAYEDTVTSDYSPKTEVIRFLLSEIDRLEVELRDARKTIVYGCLCNPTLERQE